MLEFKKATNKEQFSEIQQLAHIIWPITFKDILSDKQIIYMLDMMYSDDSLKSQIQKGCTFYQCILDSKMIGYFSIQINCQAYVTQIHKAYLNVDFQGQGYGKQTLNFIQKVAKKENQNKLQLNVNRFNKKAINFYLAYGFKIIKEEDFTIGNGFLMEDYIMQLPI